MKVLFTLDTLTGGGTETSTLDLLRNFSSENKVTVCYFYNSHELKARYEEANCSLVYMDLPGPYSFCQGIKRLVKLIRKEKFDVVVTSLYRASVMTRIACLLTRTPLIDTMVNDSYGEAKRNEFPGLSIWKFRAVFMADRLLSPIPRKWISNSAYLAVKLGSQLGISKDKIKVIYRGRKGNDIKAWTMPRASGFHFVSVGRLFPQKGQENLVRAFSRLEKKFPDCTLTIHGEGPHRSRLEALIRELRLTGKVFLPGFSANAWQKLYDAHCFVLPSHYEGFSGALVEALMTGIPVIASDIPMNAEAVEDGVNGYLFEKGDVRSLEGRMEDVISDYNGAIKMGLVAREKAVDLYDIEKVAREYENFLFDVAKGKKR